MSGLKYKPDDFYQLAPHTTITIHYKDIEKQYNLFYNKDNYIIVHRHIEYDPDKGRLTLINSNPVNFSYAQQ
jgi:hypothetical protein